MNQTDTATRNAKLATKTMNSGLRIPARNGSASTTAGAAVAISPPSNAPTKTAPALRADCIAAYTAKSLLWGRIS